MTLPPTRSTARDVVAAIFAICRWRKSEGGEREGESKLVREFFDGKEIQRQWKKKLNFQRTLFASSRGEAAAARTTTVERREEVVRAESEEGVTGARARAKGMVSRGRERKGDRCDGLRKLIFSLGSCERRRFLRKVFSFLFFSLLFFSRRLRFSSSLVFFCLTHKPRREESSSPSLPLSISSDY